jgi:uncharacterized protein (DUF697 family)
MAETATEAATTTKASTVALSPSSAPPSGRVAVMTAYAVAATVIPIPFVPDRVLARVRGAMVYDIAARHGLSVTTDARTTLSEPDSELRTKLVRTAETIARQLLRRVGPLGILASASRGVEMFALGLLFERYVTKVRRSAALRIHHDEARLVRDAIDRALLRAFSPSLKPTPTTMAEGVEDLRDEFTRWIDAFLLTTASVPSYLERRLEAAFDEVVNEMPGLRDG